MLMRCREQTSQTERQIFSIYQTLSLMIAFAILVLKINDNKNKK